MENGVGHVLGARADMQDGHDFGDGAHGGPNPSNSLVEDARRFWGAKRGVGRAQNGPEFIELQNRQRQVGEQNSMQGMGVFGGASNPTAQGIGLEMGLIIGHAFDDATTSLAHEIGNSLAGAMMTIVD